MKIQIEKGRFNRKTRFFDEKSTFSSQLPGHGKKGLGIQPKKEASQCREGEFDQNILCFLLFFLTILPVISGFGQKGDKVTKKCEAKTKSWYSHARQCSPYRMATSFTTRETGRILKNFENLTYPFVDVFRGFQYTKMLRKRPQKT